MKHKMEQPEPRIDGAHILTVSGLYVNPLALTEHHIRVDDIAHALSNQCRFTGHTREFYSVAEHSVRVARWVRAHGGSFEEQRWALLHDASEAYLIDMARPLKVDPYFGKAYRGAKMRAMAAVCRYFGMSKAMPALVKKADLALLAAERRDLMPPNGDWVILDGVEVPREVISPWSPRRSKKMFMAEYDRLFNQVSENKGQA